MENEIDLLKVISATIQRIRAHWLALVVLLFVSTGVAAAVYWMVPRKYESFLVGSSRYLKAEALEAMIAALNRAIEDENWTLVASLMGIDVNDVAGLQSLSLRDVRPAVFIPGKEGESMEFDPVFYFQITLVSQHPESVDRIQAGVLNFIEQSEFVRIRKEKYQQTGLAELDAIQKELTHLEDLRKTYYSGGKSSGISIMDPSSLNATIAELSDKARKLQLELGFNKGIQVIQGFLPYTKPSFPRKKHAGYLAVVVWVLLAGGYLITRQ